MAFYRDLLLEPKGHRRVLLLAIDGTEGPAELAALDASLAAAMDTLESSAPGLPFGLVLHLRAPESPLASSAGGTRARRDELLRRCTSTLAEQGLSLLACVAEDESGAPLFAGARFSSGSCTGGFFASLDEAYVWLDGRLFSGRTRTVGPV